MQKNSHLFGLRNLGHPKKRVFYVSHLSKCLSFLRTTIIDGKYHISNRGAITFTSILTTTQSNAASLKLCIFVHFIDIFNIYFAFVQLQNYGFLGILFLENRNQVLGIRVEKLKKYIYSHFTISGVTTLQTNGVKSQPRSHVGEGQHY